MLLAACTNNNKLDVNGYREGLKSSQKKSMPMDQKKAIEKSILPSVNRNKIR